MFEPGGSAPNPEVGGGPMFDPGGSAPKPVVGGAAANGCVDGDGAVLIGVRLVCGALNAPVEPFG